jgi:hypothetical protein
MFVSFELISPRASGSTSVSKTSCGISGHDFIRRDIANDHGPRTDNRAAAYFYSGQDHGPGTKERKFFNLHFTSYIHARTNVDALANHTVMVDRCGRIDYDSAAKLDVGTYGRHRQDLRALANLRVTRDKGARMDDGHWLHTLLLKPFLKEQTIASSVAADRHARVNLVCSGSACQP